MMLPEDVHSYFKYPLRQRTHTFVLTRLPRVSLQVCFVTSKPVTSLSSYFETDVCTNSLPLGYSNYSYSLVAKLHSAKHRQLGVVDEVYGVWGFENPETIQRTISFDFDVEFFPLTIHPVRILIYLERHIFIPPLAPELVSSRQSSSETVQLLDVETFVHYVSCDLKWTSLDSRDTPLEVGSIVLLSTKCTVPLAPTDDEFSENDITFECYVMQSVAFAVHPRLNHKEVNITGAHRVAVLEYIVEIPLLSPGVHVLNSKITYFNGHGQCDVGSSKYSTHFPVSHPLEDYVIHTSPPIHTPAAPNLDLPICSAKHLFHAVFETPTFGSIQTDIYWLHVQTCSRNDLLPQDRQRCSSFETMCGRSDATPFQPGNNGATSARNRICDSSWIIAHRNCIMDFVTGPFALLSSPSHANIARFSSRFPSIAAYGSSLSEMNIFAMMEQLGVPLDCLRNAARENDADSKPTNCIFFSHATNSSSSVRGDDINAVMRLKQILPDRKVFEITSASSESPLKGLNISSRVYPEPCKGESFFCAADNLPPISRVWLPEAGHVIDLGVERFGNDIQHCSKNSCPVCLQYSHCFRKALADDIWILSSGSPALIFLELPLWGKAESFVSNLNVILHALADSLAPGSCVLLVNGHGLHSNKEIDRKFPMRANLSSRTMFFHSQVLRIWSKAWFMHQGLCDAAAAAEYPNTHVSEPNPPECGDEIDATGLLRLLRLLNPELFLDDGDSEDVCRFGVAKIDTYAFGSGRPDASLDGVHYYAESGNKQFRIGNEVVVNVVGAMMSAVR